MSIIWVLYEYYMSIICVLGHAKLIVSLAFGPRLGIHPSIHKKQNIGQNEEHFLAQKQLKRQVFAPFQPWTTLPYPKSLWRPTFLHQKWCENPLRQHCFGSHAWMEKNICMFSASRNPSILGTPNWESISRALIAIIIAYSYIAIYLIAISYI